jgi:hypothetical protein
VRVLFGDMDIEHARNEMWRAVRDDLGLPEQAPPRLFGEGAGVPAPEQSA